MDSHSDTISNEMDQMDKLFQKYKKNSGNDGREMNAEKRDCAHTHDGFPLTPA